MQEVVEDLERNYIGSNMNQLKHQVRKVIGEGRMWYIIEIPFFVHYFAGGIGKIIDEFVGFIVIGHYRIVMIVFDTIIPPHL